MALETPNAIVVAGTALITLASIEGVAPVVRTFDLGLASSSNLSGVEFLDGGSTDDDPNPPDRVLWTVHEPANPRQMVWHSAGLTGTAARIYSGPVPTPTGVPEYDALELGQVVVGYLALAVPESPGGVEEVGNQTRIWLCGWEVPPSGEVEA